MEIKELESNLNDFIVSIGGHNNIVFDRLSFYYGLSYDLEKTLKKYFMNYRDNIDYSKISKISLLDKLELVKQFYESVGITFDIDKYINDGTIGFDSYDYFYDNEDCESEKNFRLLTGCNIYENDNKIVNSCNNGFITDILALVHELSHFRNQPDFGRNQIGDLLTESLAIAEEFICCDFLCEKGYENEVKIIIEKHLTYFYKVVKNMKPIYRMLLLFDELGSISKDDYKYYYDTDECYEKDLKILEGFDYRNYFIYYTWYVFAALLSPYLYCKYKEDKSFMKNIIKLHELINKKDILACLEEMGLTNLNYEEIKQILGSIDKIMINMDNVKIF